MKFINVTFPAPEQNLACDEALLDYCEEVSDEEILRIWEPREDFVVLGYSKSIEADVYLNNCLADQVPVLRRYSGGGTVLQSPGVLNFALILRIPESGPLSTIRGTNVSILERQRRALQSFAGGVIEHQGATDLSIDGLKFSGNAQRRRSRCLLFHGAILYSMNIARVERYLRIPTQQPPYRENRAHREFLVNLTATPSAIVRALQEEWGASEEFDHLPTQGIEQIVRERYSQARWRIPPVRRSDKGSRPGG